VKKGKVSFLKMVLQQLNDHMQKEIVGGGGRGGENICKMYS
jgi:hypothetical protein